MIGRVTLPWPGSKVMPNAIRSQNRFVSAEAIRKARRDAFLMSNAANLPVIPEDTSIIRLRVIHHLKDRRRDEDGMKGSLKPYFDGLADSLGVNDKVFRVDHEFTETASKPGKIVIEIVGVK